MGEKIPSNNVDTAVYLGKEEEIEGIDFIKIDGSLFDEHVLKQYRNNNSAALEFLNKYIEGGIEQGGVAVKVDYNGEEREYGTWVKDGKLVIKLLETHQAEDDILTDEDLA